MGRGFTVVHIYWRNLKYITVSIPPEPEQTAIVRFLDQTISDIDAAIAGTRHQIERVREYSTGFASDVVTGKLDVREVATELSGVDCLEAGGDCENAIEHEAGWSDSRQGSQTMDGSV